MMCDDDNDDNTTNWDILTWGDSNILSVCMMNWQELTMTMHGRWRAILNRLRCVGHAAEYVTPTTRTAKLHFQS